MRCQIFRRTQWSDSTGILNSFNSIFVIFIAYFAVVLINNCGVLSSEVCCRLNATDCRCNSTNNTKAVQCLLNTSCGTESIIKREGAYRYFCEVMSQYDCTTKYSVRWNCCNCSYAYTKWLIRVISKDDVTNCLSHCVPTETTEKLCNDVLARCPYLASANGYGNRPAFDCL